MRDCDGELRPERVRDVHRELVAKLGVPDGVAKDQDVRQTGAISSAGR
jgi:hypothetical protein